MQFPQPVSALRITIDPSVRYQTIDGFGGHGAMVPWWEPGPYYNQEFLDNLIDNLGLTIIRNQYYPPAEAYHWNDQKKYLQALQQKAGASGEPLTVFATFWSAPASMKTNGDLKWGGHLKPSSYTEFGQYANSCIKTHRDAGIELDVLSLQNEPHVIVFYNSCVYTAEEYRDMLKVAGPIIHNAYPSVELCGPERMADWTQWDVELDDGTVSARNYEAKVLADATARKHLDILAFHGYHNGDNDIPTRITHFDGADTVATIWGQISRLAQARDKRIWMTETGAWEHSWEGAMQMAATMLVTLKYGRVSAWVWWQLSEPGRNKHSLFLDRQPGARFFAAKHFYRYIRPGAITIDSKVADDSQLGAIAFIHPEERTLTMVIINLAGETKTIDLDSPALPGTMRMLRSTSSERCQDKGEVPTDAPISVPGSSIITLTAEGFVASTKSRAYRNHALYGTADASGASPQFYDLRGRGIGAGATVPGKGPQTPGVYLEMRNQTPGTSLMPQLQGRPGSTDLSN